MSRFGSDPLRFFTTVYEGPAPWDIGAIQPDLRALLERLPPAGPILDVGCGTGDAAIELARMGHEVVGIDFVPSAIDIANERRSALADADARGRVAFHVADAFALDGLGRTFGSAIDSGFLHLFQDDECARYLASLATVIAPGGRAYCMEFALEFDIAKSPRAVTRATVDQLLARSRFWRLLEFSAEASFQNRIQPVPGSLFVLERTSDDR